MPADRTPPDVATLPELPPRFTWQLPHVKQPRRPYPETRQIEVDGAGPAVAAVAPSLRHAIAIVGVHRALQSDRHELTFDTREAALQHVAAWTREHADQLLREIEAHRRRGFD